MDSVTYSLQAGEENSEQYYRDVDRLSMWLEATGEFREQALRFIRWRAHWETMDAEARAVMAAAIFAFAGWFASRSEAVLGKYTANVEGFLGRARNRYRWREDRVKRTRRFALCVQLVRTSACAIAGRDFQGTFAAQATRLNRVGTSCRSLST